MANPQGTSTTTQIPSQYPYFSFAKLLPFAVPYINIAKFVQLRDVPKNSSTVARFTRMERLETDPIELTEGITPDATQTTVTVITATLKEYGRFIRYTDVVGDTSFESLINQFGPVLGENMGSVVESVNAVALCAGLSAYFSNGTERTSVNTVVNAGVITKAIRYLERNFARKITQMNKAANLFNTSPIPACYVAFVHSNLRADIEAIDGFIPYQKYASQAVIDENEIGSIKLLRFILNNFMPTYLGGGGTVTSGIESTLVGGTAKANVYSIPIIGADSFATVKLAGYGAGQMYSVPLGQTSDSDPLAQRGTMGYKVWTAGTILNENWMTRIETACSA